MILAHCDGVECVETVPLDRDSQSWITVEGADIRVLHFCGLVCLSRYVSTSLEPEEITPAVFQRLLELHQAFMDQRKARPWVEPELPL